MGALRLSQRMRADDTLRFTSALTKRAASPLAGVQTLVVTGSLALRMVGEMSTVSPQEQGTFGGTPSTPPQAKALLDAKVGRIATPNRNGQIQRAFFMMLSLPDGDVVGNALLRGPRSRGDPRAKRSSASVSTSSVVPSIHGTPAPRAVSGASARPVSLARTPTLRNTGRGCGTCPVQASPRRVRTEPRIPSDLAAPVLRILSRGRQRPARPRFDRGGGVEALR